MLKGYDPLVDAEFQKRFEEAFKFYLAVPAGAIAPNWAGAEKAAQFLSDEFERLFKTEDESVRLLAEGDVRYVIHSFISLCEEQSK